MGERTRSDGLDLSISLNGSFSFGFVGGRSGGGGDFGDGGSRSD